MLKVSVGLLSIVFVLSSTGISFGQTQYGGDYKRTPSGGYVGGDSYTRTPSGGYVGGDSYTKTPSGGYVGGNSQPFGGTGLQDGLDRGHGTGLQFPR
jgi:hypothetical protein